MWAEKFQLAELNDYLSGMKFFYSNWSETIKSENALLIINELGSIDIFHNFYSMKIKLY